MGGAIFGALGFLFAPQISAALLNDEQRLRLPKFLDEEEKSPEATKQVCTPPAFSSAALARGLGAIPQPITWKLSTLMARLSPFKQ